MYICSVVPSVAPARGIQIASSSFAVLFRMIIELTPACLPPFFRLSTSTEDSAWVVVDGGVYDVTEFLEEHPGGKKILLKNCGKDASEAFWNYHSEKVLKSVAEEYKIGESELPPWSRSPFYSPGLAWPEPHH